MTNRDFYHRTFSKLQTSRDYLAEVKGMKEKRKARLPKAAVAAIIAFAASVGTSGLCYAADVGNIQRQVQLWVRGDQTDAVMDFNSTDGTYTVSYQNTDGTTTEISGGGVQINADGTETPISQEDALDDLNMPEVVTNDDGTYSLYYEGQSMDITNLFDDSGYCYVEMKDADSGKTIYVTAGKDGSVATGENRYQIPEKDFSTTGK